MLKILSRKRIVLIATHNLNAARYLGEIIFLLKGGELKGVLSKDDVFSLDAIADIFGIKDSMKKEFLKFYNIEQY
jgi:ABC-type cobalamin/Fe3+-siderophores transport system ATPase subunit